MLRQRRYTGHLYSRGAVWAKRPFHICSR